MEWVEVTAKTVDLAVKGALAELGLDSVDEASVEVIQEPDKGFLGFGGDKAIVRVKAAPKKRSRGRRGGGGGGGGGRGQGGGGDRQSRGSGDQKPRGDRQQDRKQDRQQRGGRDRQQASGGGKGGGGKGGGGKQGRSGGERDEQRRPKTGNGESSRRGGGKPRDNDGKSRDNSGRDRVSNRSEPSIESTKEADISEQADILKSFMTGLVEAFGLEGTTTTRVEDDVIYVDVVGEQTEALVGTKGSILQAILDLMKIIVQRKTHHRARIRLDIAGYAERRREALGIYSQRLSEQVLSDGEEVMLEPMHPGDRKVVHDAVADIEGVRSWSEGEEPYRSVIIGVGPGFEPTATSGDGDDDE
ncbi:MAG: Jag N-terminal domain-containing protein [Acidimicrobiia bacterium]|nr:Jag N-terminal domain-containing protein [Acidimicrobiia bacterium]